MQFINLFSQHPPILNGHLVCPIIRDKINVKTNYTLPDSTSRAFPPISLTRRFFPFLKILNSAVLYLYVAASISSQVPRSLGWLDLLEV